MKRCFPFIALIGSCLAQSAQEKAETDLKIAQDQLRKLNEQITIEESQLVRGVEKLDDEVIKKNKVLSKLLKKEDGIAGKQRRLDNELSSRRGEFEFTISGLRSHGGSLKKRLHPAEKQGFGKALEGKQAQVDQAGDDLVAEIRARFSILEAAADRLVTISGGQRIEGSALGEGSTVKGGKFAIAGPLAYFASNDGSLAGFTGFVAEGVEFPAVIPVKNNAGGTEIVSLVSTGSATVPVDASMGKALQVARSKKGIGEYLKGGGLVGYGILILGLVALLIALFKFLEIQRFPIPHRKKINLILDDLLGDRTPEAQEKAQELAGLGGELVESGVKYFFDKRRILEDALLEKLGSIQPRLERFLPFLALVAAAAPMMGLLGTVLGIMKTFAMMSAVGTGDSRAFSAGISEALITTAMGLIVAIPVIIVHGMLKSLAKAKFGQAEGTALALLNGTTEIETSSESEDDPEENVDETDLVTA